MKRRNFIAALFAPLLPIKKEEPKIIRRDGFRKLSDLESKLLGDQFWTLELQKSRHRIAYFRAEQASKGTI